MSFVITSTLFLYKYLGTSCIQGPYYRVFIKTMLTKDIQENFPFVSVISYGGAEYVGIVCNQDQYVTTMIVYEHLKSNEEKQYLLDLGEIWWWESNRMIPINIFLRNEIADLKYAIMTMNSKDVRIVIGPTVNLNNLTIKRVKRKSVQLLKKDNKFK